MRSMQSHHRCVCGRTFGNKIYIFDRVNNEPQPPVIPDTVITHKGSIPAVTRHKKDASQNDLSRQAWHKVYHDEEEVQEETYDGDDDASGNPGTALDACIGTKCVEINNNHKHWADSVDTEQKISSFDSEATSCFIHDVDSISENKSYDDSTPDLNHDVTSFNPNVNKLTSHGVREINSASSGDNPEAAFSDSDIIEHTDFYSNAFIKGTSFDPSLEFSPEGAMLDFAPQKVQFNEDPYELSDDTRPIVTDNDRTSFELEDERKGKLHEDSENGIETKPVSSHDPENSSSTSIPSLVLQLQGDNKELLEKLSASKECQMYLKQENQRLAKHIEEMVAIDSPNEAQTDTSSTDTEKELEQFKRQYIFLTQELKILRDENFDLRQSETFALSEKHKTLQDDLRPGEMKEADGTADQSRNINSDVISEPEVKTPEWEDKDTQTQCQDVQMLNLYKTTVTNLRNGVTDIEERYGHLQKAYNSVKNDAEIFKVTMTQLMSDTSKKIQDSLSAMIEENDKLKQKYVRELKLRKQLQNQVVELKGNIRVFCRIRPCIKEDNPINDASLTTRVVASPDLVDEGLVNIDNKGRRMEFDMDKVFGMESTQEEVFDEVSPLVRSALDGYNVCIFAYGQTGSGKTYTMEGPPLNPGINQRALQLLFEGLDQDGWTHGLTASVLEIYNETIRDLLNPDVSNKLEVKLRPEGGLHVPGVVLVPVTSLGEINKVFETGRRNRFTASTSMNDLSSRSHCLLCVTVHGHHADTGITTTGRLNLVDLAGSERVGRSHADGMRLEEAKNINKSLACLGDVIHALRSKQGHVPYRNSKLTYLLQDSLGGDSKTLMIVQVSPAESNVSETVCTLNFGQRVRSIEMGQATRNIAKVSTSITRRPANLNLLHTPTSPGSPSSPGSVFTSPTVLLSPSSPSPASPSKQRKFPLSSSTSSTSSPASPARLRRSTTMSSSSTQTSSSPLSSPKIVKRSSTLSSSSPSSNSSPQHVASPLSKDEEFTTSSSSSSPPSTPTTPTTKAQTPSSPSKVRKYSLPPPSPLSSCSSPSSLPSSASSPSLRRSRLSSSATTTSTTPTPKSTKSPPSQTIRRTKPPSSTTSTSSTISSSSSMTSSPLNSPISTRRGLTRHNSLRLATSPTKSSIARSVSVKETSSTPKPTIQKRPSFLRSRTNATSTFEESQQSFLASYPPNNPAATRKTTKKLTTSDSTAIPFRV